MVKLTYSTDVEFIDCANCHVTFGLTAELIAARRKDGQTFYCPNGHSNIYRDNEHDRIRRERDTLKQREAQYQDELNAERARRVDAERSAAASRGRVTKLQKRAKHGICPCCNRTFQQLARHMTTKHPAFRAEMVN